MCRELKERPVSLWDSEYGCAKFVNLTADINVDKLIRLRPNRCVFGEPPEYEGKGRPKKHGHKMKLSDPTTWAIPIEAIEIDDPKWGQIEIQRWSQFHFYHSADHPMEIILIQRKGKGLSQKAAKPMWLAWIGLDPLTRAEAPTKRKANAWKSCPKLSRSFSHDWHSGEIAQTPWKVPRLAEREKKVEKTSLSCGQKDSNSKEKRQKRGCLKPQPKLFS